MMMKTALIVSALAVVATYALPEAVVPEAPEAETTNFLSAMAFGRSKSKFSRKSIEPVIDKLKTTLQSAQKALDNKEAKLSDQEETMKEALKDAEAVRDTAIAEATAKLKADKKAADDALKVARDTHDSAKAAYLAANETFIKADEAHDGATTTKTKDLAACESQFKTATTEAHRDQQKSNEQIAARFAQQEKDAATTRDDAVSAAQLDLDASIAAAKDVADKANKEADAGLANAVKDADAALKASKAKNEKDLNTVVKLHEGERDLANEMQDVATKIKQILKQLGDPNQSKAAWVQAILGQLNKATKDAQADLTKYKADVEVAKTEQKEKDDAAQKQHDIAVSDADKLARNTKASADGQRDKATADARKKFEVVKTKEEKAYTKSKDTFEANKKTRKDEAEQVFTAASQAADETKLSCQNAATEKYTAEETAYKEAEKTMTEAQVKWGKDQITWHAIEDKQSTKKTAALDLSKSKIDAANDKFDEVETAEKKAMAASKKDFDDAKNTHDTNAASIEKVLEILEGLTHEIAT